MPSCSPACEFADALFRDCEEYDSDCDDWEERPTPPPPSTDEAVIGEAEDAEKEEEDAEEEDDDEEDGWNEEYVDCIAETLVLNGDNGAGCSNDDCPRSVIIPA